MQPELIDVNNYPASSPEVAILMARDGVVTPSKWSGSREVQLRLLENLTYPMQRVVTLPAPNLDTSSAVYFGAHDRPDGVWFVGFEVLHYLKEVEIYRGLVYELECADRDPEDTPFARLLGHFYNEECEMLGSSEIAEAQVTYAKEFNRFIQFYVWMKVQFADAWDSAMADGNVSAESWLTLRRAALWASLDSDELRRKFLRMTGTLIRERRSYQHAEQELQLYGHGSV